MAVQPCRRWAGASGQRPGSPDGCGAAVNAPPERAEYKQVTVLFADVVESMRLVQRPLGWGCEAIDAGGGLRTKVGGWGCPGWSVYASGFV